MLYTLKYVKFRVCDTSRLSRSCLFQHCRVIAHPVSKMPSRRMHKDAITFKCLRLPSSVAHYLTNEAHYLTNVVHYLTHVAYCLTHVAHYVTYVAREIPSSSSL